MTLALRNRQRVRPVDLRFLRRLTRALLRGHFRAGEVELCLHLVAAPEMARLNERFLGHQGSTDVITFDHADAAFRVARRKKKRGTRNAEPGTSLRGEIFLCLDAAVAHARQFRTTWQSELVRYVIHGLLHLRGFDDRQPAARANMKREENRLLREIGKDFALTKLGTRNTQRGPRDPSFPAAPSAS
jgi:probable rRNA maturation factor